MLKRRIKTGTRIDVAENLIPLALFILLVSLMVIERIIFTAIFALGFTCDEQRVLFVGETSSSHGLYDLIVHIGALALIVCIIDWIGLALDRRRNQRFSWSLRLINILLAATFLGLASKPWAHFNVESPTSNFLFKIHNAVSPASNFVRPMRFETYVLDKKNWDCLSAGCDGVAVGEDWYVQSQSENLEFRHRRLGFSVRAMAYYECHSPDFNQALDRAYSQQLGPINGDKRRFTWVYFDEQGRFIPNQSRLKDTAYLRSQLAPAQLQPTDWAFEDVIFALALDHEAHKHDEAEMSE